MYLLINKIIRNGKANGQIIEGIADDRQIRQRIFETVMNADGIVFF